MLNNLEIASTPKTTTMEVALQYFDSLEPVGLKFMRGRWHGSGLHTSHPLDGWLEGTHWHGKEFITAEQVHPLLFEDRRKRIFKVAPNPFFLRLCLPLLPLKNKVALTVVRSLLPLFKTEMSQAKLQLMEYRQQVSATMIYNNLPIHDVFRKVDDNTVLGLMDFNWLSQPFFFILEREN